MGNATPTPITPGVLKVATYGGFAPVCCRGRAGNLAGFDVGFLTRFADAYGLVIQTSEHPFGELWALPGKADGDCDIAGAGIMQRGDRDVGERASWSQDYFRVQRSLLVRAHDAAAFADHTAVAGKTIVVTEDSTAHTDAGVRYPKCHIRFVSQVVPKGETDPQRYIVELIGNGDVDAFGEGDVSNEYLRKTYGPFVPVDLALADVHMMDGLAEPFNFVVRNLSGLLDQLNAFIVANKASYNAGDSCC